LGLKVRRNKKKYSPREDLTDCFIFEAMVGLDVFVLQKIYVAEAVWI
jgi:hypothetical protein